MYSFVSTSAAWVCVSDDLYAGYPYHARRMISDVAFSTNLVWASKTVNTPVSDSPRPGATLVAEPATVPANQPNARAPPIASTCAPPGAHTVRSASSAGIVLAARAGFSTRSFATTSLFDILTLFAL